MQIQYSACQLAESTNKFHLNLIKSNSYMNDENINKYRNETIEIDYEGQIC